jgi:gamma-glutamylcyclotransferase (GGCT)/AIG2-like uncharacterized protein YtfP
LDKDNFAGAHLFVYGTLRKGFRSHGWLSRLHARLIATGSVRGRLYDLGEYPGAVESERDADRVQGEVYWLPSAAQAIRILDKFEGFDPARPAFNLFERRKTTVVITAGGEKRAWIYWLGSSLSLGRRVPSGNYALRRM